MYPLDYKNKEGKLFWTLPKRPPTPLEFSLEEKLHEGFIKHFARMQASIWGITVEENKLEIIIKEMTIEPFKPKDEDIKKIKKDVA